MSSPAPSAALPPPVAFSQPWQLRAYVIASALVERDVVARDALGNEDGEAALRSWLAAIERTLLEQGQISAEELDAEIARHAAIAAAKSVH